MPHEKAAVNRREAILKAAVKLFAEKGFACTPTSEIARTAGVAEGTIFHHFGSKDEILLVIFRELVADYLSSLEERVKEAPTGLDALEGIVRSHFSFVKEKSREYLIVLRDLPYHLIKPGSPHQDTLARVQRALVDVIKECIARGKEDGTIGSEVPEEETAFLIRGMLHGISRQVLLWPMEVPDQEEAVVEMLRRSLRNEREMSLNTSQGGGE